MTANAAIWVRVSTDRQHEDNQIPDLERLCQHRGLGDHPALRDRGRLRLQRRAPPSAAAHARGRAPRRVLRARRLGRRPTLPPRHRGAPAAHPCQLRERNVSLVSHQEPWLNGTDSTTELLTAVAAWVATQESVRRSERIRAGLARRKAQGKPIGGAASKRGKDKRPRETEGYKQAWARRKAAP